MRHQRFIRANGIGPARGRSHLARSRCPGRKREPQAGSPSESLAARRSSSRAGAALRARGRRCVRKPYSFRSASAASSRPTTLSAAFATIRRSTSLAVCCAPNSETPSERPRSAISRSRPWSGLHPSRGAYLFSSSSTTNTSGREPPCCSFWSIIRFKQHANHEQLGGGVQRMNVDDRDLLRRPVDRAIAGLRVSAHQMAHALGRGVQSTTKRVESAGWRSVRRASSRRGSCRRAARRGRRTRRQRGAVDTDHARFCLIAFSSRPLERVLDT